MAVSQPTNQPRRCTPPSHFATSQEQLASNALLDPKLQPIPWPGAVDRHALKIAVGHDLAVGWEGALGSKVYPYTAHDWRVTMV